MSEWSDAPGPQLTLESIEIITLDSLKGIKTGEKVSSWENCSLPEKSVGRIYTTRGGVTGWVVYTPLPDSPLPNGALGIIVTVGHVKSLFTLNETEHFGISFELKPNPCYYTLISDIHKGAEHTCTPEFLRLEAYSYDYNHTKLHTDPLTHYPSPLQNDITLFYVLPSCPCGNAFSVPYSIRSLNILSVNPAENTACKVYGYPGAITRQSTLSLIPHKDQVSVEEINKVSKAMKKDTLIISNGEVLKLGEDLIAVDNSTSPGMAGSPIVVNENNEWKVAGMILGGPAVPGQFEFADMVTALKGNNKEKVLDILSKIISNENHHFNEVVLNICKSLKTLVIAPEVFMALALQTYKMLMKIYYTYCGSFEMMNHNLGLSFTCGDGKKVLSEVLEGLRAKQNFKSRVDIREEEPSPSKRTKSSSD
jgi:hypothetical protein